VKNPNYPLKKIKEIIDSKAKWIYEKVENAELKLLIKEICENENKILYLGSKIPIQINDIEKFYREKTKEIVYKEIEKISKKMELYPTKISFRKTKNRWGSCNHKNELSFTITLTQLPLECIRYIIVHELAHIIHKNHKKQFYQTIQKYMPHFKTQEKIIKNYSPMI